MVLVKKWDRLQERREKGGLGISIEEGGTNDTGEKYGGRIKEEFDP